MLFAIFPLVAPILKLQNCFISSYISGMFEVILSETVMINYFLDYTTINSFKGIADTFN